MYVLPQVLVFQEFNSIPDEITDPLRACIFAPQADLHRYSDADEKDTIELGEYSPLADATYSYPSRAVGGVVDQDYVKLFVDDALLQYHHTDLSDAEIAPVSGYANRIKADTLAFKSNGEDYPRSADFLDRDVAAGDTVYVRGVVGGDSVELWTYVKGFVAEVVAAVVGDAFPAAENAEDQSSSIEFAQSAGTDNNVAITGNLSTYDGRADGGINEVYTVTVISGSTGGDATTAKCRLASASGNDDVAEFTPAAFASVAEVGARGLRLGFTTSGGSELIAGQTFTVTVAQAFESAIARSAGTYSGTADTTYIVEVTRGGVFGAAEAADQPQITVSTTTGSDYSGPTTIEEDSVLIPIGTKGVKIRFGGSGADSVSSIGGSSEALLDPVTGLRKGDRFYIPVTAVANGRISTLILGHNLSDDLQAATDLDLKLYIKKDLQVSMNREEAAPLVNYTVEETQVVVKSGMTAFDSSWTDDGVQVALDVVGGTLYLEYREWLQDSVGTIQGIRDVGELDADIAGPLDKDNPLKWGVYYALLNANGTEVKYTGISDPADTDEWVEALELAVGRDDVYNLIPLTRNSVVLNAFAGHVASQSSAENGRWRGTFINLEVEESYEVVGETTSSDSNVVLATLHDDPEASGTQYSLLRITSGNVDLTQTVAAGDTVRFLFQTGGFGEVSYQTFLVDDVINDEEVRLFTAHTTAVSVPQKVEIYHTRSKTELANAVATQAGSYGSRRVCAVWPDRISSGGTEMEGYFLCAALGGLASGVAPHQGLTNVEITGFDDVSRTVDYFNGTQLNTLAASGVWIVTQAADGNIITRHALTTDNTDTNTSEEMRRRNADSMSYLFLNRLKDFIGKANVTPSALALIRVQLISAIEYLKQNGFIERLGGQLIDGDIRELRQHPLLKDRVVAVLELEAPFPLNNLEVHLVL